MVLGLSAAASAVAVGFWLTPLAFFVAELLPKEMFRRRPHGLLPLAIPLLLISRVAFFPLERALRVLTYAIERLFGVADNTAAVLHGREGWQARFDEVRRAGILHERSYRLMRNAMKLRSTPVQNAMIPWDQVVFLRASDTPAQRFAELQSSRFSRLPVVNEQGTVLGYLHQLDGIAWLAGQTESGGLRALGRGTRPANRKADDQDWVGLVHDVPALHADLSVSEALLTLKGLGKRAAVIGTLENPQGWVTLKDLVEELTGDLVGL